MKVMGSVRPLGMLFAALIIAGAVALPAGGETTAPPHAEELQAEYQGIIARLDGPPEVDSLQIIDYEKRLLEQTALPDDAEADYGRMVLEYEQLLPGSAP